MINKHALYPFLFPLRSRLQGRLRSQRLNADFGDFAREVGCCASNVAWPLWNLLREAALVPDFRPAADDDLGKVFAMGPEEVRDDLIEPLLAELDLCVRDIDFTSFDFSSLATPRDVAAFVAKVAAGRI